MEKRTEIDLVARPKAAGIPLGRCWTCSRWRTGSPSRSGFLEKFWTWRRRRRITTKNDSTSQEQVAQGKSIGTNFIARNNDSNLLRGQTLQLSKMKYIFPLFQYVRLLHIQYLPTKSMKKWFVNFVTYVWSSFDYSRSPNTRGKGN